MFEWFLKCSQLLHQKVYIYLMDTTVLLVLEYLLAKTGIGKQGSSLGWFFLLDKLEPLWPCAIYFKSDFSEGPYTAGCDWRCWYRSLWKSHHFINTSKQKTLLPASKFLCQISQKLLLCASKSSNIIFFKNGNALIFYKDGANKSKYVDLTMFAI